MSNPFAGSPFGGTSGGVALPGITRSAPANVPRYRAGRAEALAGVAARSIAFIGDSTTRGLIEDPGGSISPHASSYPIQAARLSGFPGVETGALWGSGGSVSGRPPNVLDTRLVYGSGWSNVGPFSIGGPMLGNNSTTDPVSLAPAPAFDTIAVWYVRNTGLATFTIGVDGGAALATVDANGAVGLIRQLVTVPYGTHTVNVARTGTGGFLFLMAIETYTAGARGLAFNNFGSSGSTSGNWNANVLAYDPLKAVIATAPSLAIVDLGINDARTGVPSATFGSNMTSIVTALLPTMDVALAVPVPVNVGTTTQAIQDEYRNVILGIADQYGLPVIDHTTTFQSWVDGNTRKLYSGQLHPGAGGYVEKALLVNKLLTA